MTKQFKALPDHYRSECEQQGVIESVNYPVPNLADRAKEKHLNIYLPYGYDHSDASKQYPVFYLMHGGGEDENLLFGGPGENRELKNILDHMIANRDIAPLIVVTPTFYGVKNDLKNDPKLSHVELLDHPLPIVETEYFYDELINDLIPFVETKYHTYAKSGSKEDIIASRDYRAFGGFSMGAVTTWNIFIHALAYVKYFVPLSGDCWALAQKGEGEKAQETAEYLARVARNSGYRPKDYYLFCATGNRDIAYPNMKPQMDALKEFSDQFIDSADTSKGNFYFIDCYGGDHTWHWQNQYIYNILPDLFKDCS